jgi:hypothetical protein
MQTKIVKDGLEYFTFINIDNRKITTEISKSHNSDWGLGWIIVHKIHTEIPIESFNWDELLANHLDRSFSYQEDDGN